MSSEDRRALINDIKETVIFDAETVPAWASKNEKISAGFVSTSEELKQRLRRISFPKISLSFEPLSSQLMSIKASQKLSIATTPILRDKAKEDALLEKYFNSFENSTPGNCSQLSIYQTNG